MLEGVKANIMRMIALYEGEKQRADSLENLLRQSEIRADEYKTQIIELNSQIDNLKLTGVFTGSGDPELAKARIDKLVRDIDKCLKLLTK